MAGIHAKIPPSSMGRIVRCPGSRTLAENLPPKPDTPEAIEGTVAHIVARAYAHGTETPLGTEIQGVKVTEDMLFGARLWKSTIGEGGADELPVMIQAVHPDCWGTPDFWKWEPETEELTIIDYKFGFDLVDEFENWQLLAYASGVARSFGVEPKTVRLGIVQPRGYGTKPVRFWAFAGHKLAGYEQTMREAVNNGTATNAGPQCLYCPAREVCGTFQRAASEVVQFAGSAEPVALSPAQIGAELTVLAAALEILTSRHLALSVLADQTIRGGADVPGWGLKPGKSNLAWHSPADIISYGDMLGIDLRQPQAPITPTQALDRKLLDEESVKALASRPPAGMKLTAISTSLTRRIFS